MNQKLKNEELERLSIEQFKDSEKNKIVLVLDNVRSLNNVGSVFRTSDAFLIEEIYLCGVTGIPPNKEIEKTALGATQTVNWKYFASTIAAITALREKNYHVLAVEQAEKSISLEKISIKNQGLGLIFGNEVYGVEQEAVNACDGVVEIPQMGSKHSLNISVSVGIVLWEILRERFN